MKIHHEAMLGLATLFAVSLAGFATTWAEENEFEARQAAFTANLELLKEPLTKLDQSYEGALNRFLETATAKGDLEAVLAIRDELANYRTGPSEKLGASKDLAGARKVYEENRKQRVEALAGKLDEQTGNYARQLEALVVTLTQKSQVEAAVAAKKEAERMRALLADPAKLSQTLINITIPAESAAPSSGQSSPDSTPLEARLAGTLELMGVGGGVRLAQLHPDQRTDVVAVTCTWTRWLALKKDGSILVGSHGGGSDPPAGIAPAVRLRISGGVNTAFHADGTATCWGQFEDPSKDKPPADLGPVRDLACTGSSGIAALPDGSVRVWGSIYPSPDAARSVEAKLRDIFLVEVSEDTAWAVSKSGAIYRWSRDKLKPEQIERLSKPLRIDSSNSGFAVLSGDGTVKGWNQWPGGVADLLPEDPRGIRRMKVSWACVSLQTENGEWITAGGKFPQLHEKIRSLGPLIDAEVSAWSTNGLAAWIK